MRICPVCKEIVTGREGAIYCSDRCRLRALRAKRKGAQIGPLSVSSGVARGYASVTDNPPLATRHSTPGRHPNQEELDREFPIPDDLTIPKWLRREPDAPHWKDYGP